MAVLKGAAMTPAERSKKFYYNNLKKVRKWSRDYMRQRRRENPEWSRASVHRYHRKRNVENKKQILEWKLNHPCADCGETDPVVLDAHHRNPRRKNFRLGAYTRESVKAVKTELVKCISLCANCHRRRHARS
jgi:hypothetical protein